MIQHYKSGEKKSIKNIEKILLELSETPFEGIGNPEPLKYELTSKNTFSVCHFIRIHYLN
ncbi:type II toxin-antitoxin system YoeB family toxin [Flavobacterium circumlabens]|uniref:type II toxin-antitoxin system YoeB family toxin n=1 Tax=Flavobacterium circumlabens TaxID=2133765 RepID=UPI003D655FFF